MLDQRMYFVSTWNQQKLFPFEIRSLLIRRDGMKFLSLLFAENIFSKEHKVTLNFRVYVSNLESNFLSISSSSIIFQVAQEKYCFAIVWDFAVTLGISSGGLYNQRDCFIF